MFSIPEFELGLYSDVCSKDCLSFQIKSLESRVINQLVEGFEAQWLGSPAMGLRAKHQDALL